MTDIELIQHIELAEKTLSNIKHEVIWGRKYDVKEAARKAYYEVSVINKVINATLCHCKKPVNEEGKCDKCGYGYGGMPLS